LIKIFFMMKCEW